MSKTVSYLVRAVACASASAIFNSAVSAATYAYYNANAAPTAPSPVAYSFGNSNAGVSGSTANLTYIPGTDGGTNVWQINDTSGSTANGGDGTAGASQKYTKANIPTTANNSGWDASITLKVAEARGTITNAGTTTETTSSPVVFTVTNAHYTYALAFIQDSVSGYEGVYYTPSANLLNGSLNYLANTGLNTHSTLIQTMDLSTGFNTFSMVYTPNPADPTHSGGATSYTGDYVSVFINNATTPAFTLNSSDNPAPASSATFGVGIATAAGADTENIEFSNISLVSVVKNLKVWSGGSSTWDVGTTSDWNSNATTFTQYDDVQFDDTNTGSYTITTGATTVTPGSLAITSAQAYTFNGTGGIGGFTGWNQSGGGSATVQNVNTFTGPVNITGTATTLSLSSTGKLATAALTVGAGSIANITGLLTGTPAVTVYGTMTFGANAMDGTNGTAGTILNRSIGALNVTGTLNFAPISAGNQSSRSVLIATALTNTGVIDLSNNDAIIRNASLGSLTTAGSVSNQLATGYNSGKWNGPGGIVSTTAAADTTHLTAIGSMPGGNTFDGVSTFATDVILKYTYYGDATLDGKVDGSDYSRIDSGFLTGATGWTNGDFNYDGVVNGSDYTLIDNAFNTQGSLLAAEIAVPTAQIAGTTAVPEPTSIAFIGISALGLLRRRKRN
jgi:hypothetical protein